MTPAQIANDCEAWARHFDRPDKDVARLFRDTARIIRAVAAGGAIDGRTLGGLDRRQINFLYLRQGREEAYESLSRARRQMQIILSERART